MAYDAVTAGGYSGRGGYDMAMFINRAAADNANNRSAYAWSVTQRNYASSSPSWFLDAKPYSVQVAYMGWSGSINCDFRGIPYGGSREVTSGGTDWFTHDSAGYLNVAFAAYHDTGSAGWGVANPNATLYTDRLPKAPAAPGTPYLYSLIPAEYKARVIVPASPDNNGATIDQYLVRASVNSNPETAPYQDLSLSPSLLYGDLVDLLPGTRYYMKAYAHNSMGWTSSGIGYFDTEPAVRVGKSDIFQGVGVFVGKGGAFVSAETRVGKGGSFVLPG